jgi:hypothetical protein
MRNSDIRATSKILLRSRSYNHRDAVRLFLVQPVETNVAFGDSPLHGLFWLQVLSSEYSVTIGKIDDRHNPDGSTFR